MLELQLLMNWSIVFLRMKDILPKNKSYHLEGAQTHALFEYLARNNPAR
jgi:hypothetical protein